MGNQTSLSAPGRSVLAAFALVVLAWPAPPPAAGQPPPCPLTFACLASMSRAELECLYRQSTPGPIPHGYLTGHVVPSSDTACACAGAAGRNCLWHGKWIDACAGTSINQWAWGQSITACVYHGCGWLDGGPAIIVDYSRTSRAWRNVKDELRQVGPGLYIGLMYREGRRGRQLDSVFVLRLEPACRTAE